MSTEPRILVVDDDHPTLTLLARILRNEGFHFVEKANSGQAALEKCQTSPPDIVFMDIEMPDLSGIETMQMMHDQGIPALVVLVSASPLSQYVMAAKQNNAAGFLVKPLSPKLVSDTIKKCMKHMHLEPDEVKQA